MNPGNNILLGHLSGKQIPSAVKDRHGSEEDSKASGWITFFFKLTENNTLSVLIFWNILHFMYAGLWGGLLMFSVIDNGLAYDFTQAFNPVYFIMQGLVLKSLYDEYTLGNVFYAMITEVRVLARKIASFHDGGMIAASMANKGNVDEAEMARLAQVKASIRMLRDLLMVYTYCTFELFGLTDDMGDYEPYDFVVTLNLASRKLYKNRLSDEDITHIIEGAEYYMIREITILHKLHLLTGDMGSALIRHMDAISNIASQIWVGMKPWKSEILVKLPSLYLMLYKYLLVPLGTFSTVGPVWGIIVYGSILFIYNSAGIVVWWLGDPFSRHARHVPVAFSKLRQQQYANISELLDADDRKIRGYVTHPRTIVYVGDDEHE